MAICVKVMAVNKQNKTFKVKKMPVTEQQKRIIHSIPDCALPIAIAYAEGYRSGAMAQRKDSNNGHLHPDSTNDYRVHRDREEVKETK